MKLHKFWTVNGEFIGNRIAIYFLKVLPRFGALERLREKYRQILTPKKRESKQCAVLYEKIIKQIPLFDDANDPLKTDNKLHL